MIVLVKKQMLKNKYFLILLITLFTSSCNSPVQSKAQTDKETEPIKYGSGDVVTKGYLDKSGNMWFTTTLEGIFKYDGKSFSRITVEDGLCGNQVWAITEDTDGNMWFGTENGLCKFDGEAFENISIPNTPIDTDWLKSSYPIVNPNAVTGLIQDSTGDFWMGTNGAGAYRYDGNEFTAHLKESGKLMPDSLHHNVILSVVEDNSGDIWFSSFSHGGVSQFNGNKFVHHALKDGFGDGMTSTLYLDKKGSLWVGTRNGGIYKYDGKSFQNIQGTNSTEQIAMATFLEDSKGTFWVVSYARKGVYQYDGKSFKPFELKDSDQLIDIKSLSEDKDGSIWFGGRYGILWRYDGKALKDFTQSKRIE